MTFKERMKGFVMSSFIGRQLVKLWVYREHNVDVHLESEQKGATKQYYDLDENEIEEIINNSDEVRLITPLPENIADNWEMQDDLTDEEEAIMIASMQNNKLEDDIPDQVLNDEHFSYEDAMEYNEAWYPDTGNDYPNTSSIKLWIQEVKWAGLDDIDLYYEYVERYDVKKPRADHRINFKEKERLLDSTSYLIARKQWYCGRKPQGMSDWDWHIKTRDMRPPAGTFGKKGDEMWEPYDRDYVYKSGHTKEFDRKLKEGEKVEW